MTSPETSPNLEQIAGQEEAKQTDEQIVEEFFDPSKKTFGDWWIDRPNASRIKGIVKSKLGLDQKSADEGSSEPETSGTAFMNRERKDIQDLRKKMIGIVNRMLESAIEFEKHEMPITEEIYQKAMPKIIRELDRNDISTDEDSDGKIILDDLKETFIGLSYNGLRAVDEVSDIANRKIGMKKTQS